MQQGRRGRLLTIAFIYCYKKGLGRVDGIAAALQELLGQHSPQAGSTLGGELPSCRHGWGEVARLYTHEAWSLKAFNVEMCLFSTDVSSFNRDNLSSLLLIVLLSKVKDLLPHAKSLGCLGAEI